MLMTSQVSQAMASLDTFPSATDEAAVLAPVPISNFKMAFTYYIID